MASHGHISMLTATDARSHVHLIVGSNPLAAARCGQSLSAGASPILLAPETTELHYTLQKRVDDGEVKWMKEDFRDDHLLTLGREEIGHVVDAVFVTSGPREPLSTNFRYSLRYIASTLTKECRRAHIVALQTQSNTRKRCRCASALYF